VVGAVVKRALALAAVAVLTGAGLAACASGGGDGANGTGRPTVLKVVTTTTQVTDLARNVGGDQVTVYPVLKANVDPHDYEPTPADLDAIARADVIVKNGVGLEKWFDDTIASASPRGAIVDASQGIALRRSEGHDDPHIWQDPQNAKRMVATMAKAFSAADPGAATTFAANLVAYSARLDALDAAVQAQIATLTNKKLVTNHDAFGYYVDRYGLDFVGSVIPSFDSQAELSPADINDLVATIKAEGVKAVFSESSLPPKTAVAVAQEAGVKVVAGPGSLFGDSLGPVGSAGDTYVTMIEHNTTVIVENLR
jgi:ABC-type Zn uptake system ZnuABC Zn-binding protein ZnuA